MNISNANVEKIIEKCFSDYLKGLCRNRSLKFSNLSSMDLADYYHAWGTLQTLSDLKLISDGRYRELRRDLNNRELAAKGLASS
jgi:hypothetical protein